MTDVKIKTTDCCLVQGGNVDVVGATLKYVTDGRGQNLIITAKGVKIVLGAREIRKLLGKKDGR